MPSCIYCKAQTVGSEPPEHPIPEALGSSEVLPRGACCTACNSYMADLDKTIVDHPRIRMTLVFGEILGKRGKRKTDLSRHVRVHQDSSTVHVKLDPSGGEVTPQGFRIPIEYPKGWSEWKFSRGLHKVALGLVAWRCGAADALQAPLDTVRNYVRQPAGRHIRRPYAERLTRIPADLDVFRTRVLLRARHHYRIEWDTPAWVLVYLNFIYCEYIVCLLGDLTSIPSAQLESFMAKASLNERSLEQSDWQLRLTG